MELVTLVCHIVHESWDSWEEGEPGDYNLNIKLAIEDFEVQMSWKYLSNIYWNFLSLLWRKEVSGTNDILGWKRLSV